jgi:hypothetical protein
MCHVRRPSHSCWLDHLNNIWWWVHRYVILSNLVLPRPF